MKLNLMMQMFSNQTQTAGEKNPFSKQNKEENNEPLTSRLEEEHTRKVDQILETVAEN
jgi:hypothetical protein